MRLRLERGEAAGESDSWSRPWSVMPGRFSRRRDRRGLRERRVPLWKSSLLKLEIIRCWRDGSRFAIVDMRPRPMTALETLVLHSTSVSRHCHLSCRSVNRPRLKMGAWSRSSIHACDLSLSHEKSNPYHSACSLVAGGE